MIGITAGYTTLTNILLLISNEFYRVTGSNSTFKVKQSVV